MKRALEPAIDPISKTGAGMGEKIVTMGRGGTGKTAFVALMTKFFGEIGVEPIFLIDADPDQNLPEMVGVDLREEGKKTISEEIHRIREERLLSKIQGRTAADKMEPSLFENSIWEGKFFDISAIGTKWDRGCYCIPNRALERIMEKWSSNYRYVLIDSPAGLEHLNRRITSEVKDIFNIIDPSKKSIDNAARAYRIIKEVDISFRNYYLVGGYRFPSELEKEVRKKTNFEYLGKIAYDKQVERYNYDGKSLLDLPEDSVAYRSVKQIMKRAGYGEPSLNQSEIPKQT